METKSVKIIIADLQSKYNSATSEKNEQRFFLKLTSYGKDLIDHQDELEGVLIPLFKEAEEMISDYKKHCEEFIKAWKPYAKDLIEKAQKLDVVKQLDYEPTYYYSTINELLKSGKSEGHYMEVDNYYFPYMKIVYLFEDLAKKSHIKNHLDEEGNILLFYPYQNITGSWEGYKSIRGISVWWAHYQIMRATHGILRLKDDGQYFSGDTGIDDLYRYEFKQIQLGEKSELGILRRQDFQEYLERFHNYLIPRLEETKEKPSVLSIKFENDALFLKLNDRTDTSLDFTSMRGNNDMLILFKIYFAHWQKHKDEPLPSSELKIRLQSAGIDQEQLQGNFLSTTNSNIRKKIVGRHLEDVITITYDKQQKGYSLKIITSN